MKKFTIVSVLTLSALVGLQSLSATATEQEQKSKAVLSDTEAVATFAGGCFWCVEAGFEKLHGVREAISGYTGGTLENPTYKQVSSGTTRHIESVQVYYDPQVISYNQLLDAFWRQIDPTDENGSFVDRGHQYSPAIFYENEDEKRLAESSMRQLALTGRYDKPIRTAIRPLTTFYPAESYHQDYYKKNPIRYKFYRYNSGRDQYLDKIWTNDLTTGHKLD